MAKYARRGSFKVPNCQAVQRKNGCGGAYQGSLVYWQWMCLLKNLEEVAVHVSSGAKAALEMSVNVASAAVARAMRKSLKLQTASPAHT